MLLTETRPQKDRRGKKTINVATKADRPIGDYERSERAKLDRILASDAKEFILHVLREAEGTAFAPMDANTHSLRPWSSLSAAWRSDRDVAFTALTHEHIKVYDLPDKYRSNQDFIHATIEANGKVWMGLPEEYSALPSFARSIKRFDDKELALKVLAKVPSFRQDRAFWKTVIDSEFQELFKFMRENAAAEILKDKMLIVRACGDDPRNLSEVDPSLMEESEFVDLLLGRNPLFLPHIPHKTQLMFPGLVALAFAPYSQNVGRDAYEDLLRTLAPDLFQNRLVMRAWFEQGWPFEVEHHPRRWLSDRMSLLLIAQHCSRDHALKSFRYANPKALADKEFMAEIIEISPFLFLLAHPTLHTDYDLALLAFGKSKEFAEQYAGDTRFDGFIEQFKMEIGEKLENDSSVFNVLCGVSDDAACMSPVLKSTCGNSVGYSVADFLNLPSAAELRLLRSASENLSYAFNPSSLPTFSGKKVFTHLSSEEGKQCLTARTIFASLVPEEDDDSAILDERGSDGSI